MKKKIVSKPAKKKVVKKINPKSPKETEKLFHDTIMQNLGASGDGIFVLVSDESPADDVEYIKMMSKMFQNEHAKFVSAVQFMSARANYEVEVKTFFRFRKL